jgi:UV DNA damage repair endonuclease
MFNQNINRVGFACKFEELSVPNIKSTTITWLNSAPKQKAVEKLWDLLKHNIVAMMTQVNYVGSLPPNRRMLRISSDVLPAYTHDNWSWFYWESDVQVFLERELLRVGDRARLLDVRLSFHPGQFCVLASDNPGVVENSLEEFEYHCDIIRYMGFGKTFQDFKCNVHIGGKGGPDGIKAALSKLSSVARNVITIENDEFKWGIEASLELVDHCALVLDIHHHWIRTGEYLEPTDPRVLRMMESWRGVRPVIHYSLSREEVIGDYWDPNFLPNLTDLVGMYGYTKTQLRAHSDYYWNVASNRWCYKFSSTHDIMLESKMKNLAADKFCLEMAH